MSFVFTRCELNKIGARAIAENLAARSFLEHVGFAVEGRLRDHFYWKAKFHDVVLFGIRKAQFERW